MFNQQDFGKRLREFRAAAGLTQREEALKIGVSEQAVSKWENGSCLPDVYNLKLLGRVLGVSVDCLLDVENEQPEKVVDSVKVGGAVFEIVEKPETILAGKIIYAKDFNDYNTFDEAIGAIGERGDIYEDILNCVLPICDIHLSINFWREERLHGYGLVREVSSVKQPEGVDVYRLPASLYIRAYTDKQAAQLLSKDKCEVWELFAYIRNHFMPSRGFVMAQNGAQEMEVFDTSEHKSGWAYMPVERV